MAANPNCFKAARQEESFAAYMEAANIMKDILGDSRQVRDTEDRCPPEVGYSYSRVAKHVDDRPDCYDYDDGVIQPRTRGYAPGNVRSLSSPPKKTVNWLNTLEGGSFTQTLSTDSLQTMETRFASLTLSKDWSRYHVNRTKEADRVKEERRMERMRAKERNVITTEIRSGIETFEKNISVIHDSRQVRDTEDRCPPEVGYSYSRVAKHVDDRPDCYDYDDGVIQPRTRGYAPGNVRSLSSPPKKTVNWLNTLEGGSFTQTLSTDSLQTMETRFASLTLSKDWSRYHVNRTKEADRVKEERRMERMRAKERNVITTEIRSGIETFEKNISVIHNDSDDDDDM